jgi:hypothetical protein
MGSEIARRQTLRVQGGRRHRHGPTDAEQAKVSTLIAKTFFCLFASRHVSGIFDAGAGAANGLGVRSEKLLLQGLKLRWPASLS